MSLRNEASLPVKDPKGSRWLHRKRQFDRGLSCPLQTTSAILSGSKSSCLLLRIVLHDEVTEPENALCMFSFKLRVLLITSGWG